MEDFYICRGNPRLDVNYAKSFGYWSVLNMSAPVSYPGTAPGGNSAYDCRPTATTGTHSIRRNIETVDDCLFYADINFVTYIKALGNQRTVCFIVKQQDDTYYARVFADLVNGVIVPNPTYDDYTHSSIKSLGDGWYKVIVTVKGEYNLRAKDVVQSSIMYLVDPASDFELSYTASTYDGIRVWKSFTFFGDSAHNYFPDMTEAASSEYNRAQSQSAVLHVGWSAKFPNTQVRFDATDLSGRRSFYITGSYNKWELPIPIIEAHRAHMINHWWRDRDPVYFYNGIDSSTTKVMIVNKSEPFSWARKPYHDIMTGTLELEAVE